MAVGDLNERIAEKLEEFEIDGIDTEQRLEEELKRDYHVVTADVRLDQVVRDFVRHYSAAWETGKAMLICIDKLTCVRVHGLIARYWEERIAELELERASTSDEQEDIYLERQIAWMRGTRSAPERTPAPRVCLLWELSFCTPSPFAGSRSSRE